MDKGWGRRRMWTLSVCTACCITQILTCFLGKGERVQGPSGGPQQAVKEGSPVSAPKAEWRLCHYGGGQGGHGGEWGSKSFHPSPALFLGLLHFPPHLHVSLLLCRTCCTRCLTMGGLWRCTRLTTSETMPSSKSVSLRSCCTEHSRLNPQPLSKPRPTPKPFTFWPLTSPQKMEVACTANRSQPKAWQSCPKKSF